MAESSISDVLIRVAEVVPATTAEGPGRRYAIWVQGCTIRCDGCFNPHMWSKAGGARRSVGELLARIEAVDVEGITLLGGEPFEQGHALSILGEAVQRRGLSVMTFTGYDYGHLTGSDAPDKAEALIGATDLLVTGPYVAESPDLVRPWVGSTNQEFHFLTERYGHLQEHLGDLRDRIEVRVMPNGAVAVNGWAGVDQLDDLFEDLGRPVGRGRVR